MKAEELKDKDEEILPSVLDAEKEEDQQLPNYKQNEDASYSNLEGHNKDEGQLLSNSSNITSVSQLLASQSTCNTNDNDIVVVTTMTMTMTIIRRKKIARYLILIYKKQIRQRMTYYYYNRYTIILMMKKYNKKKSFS